jgi:hypothetical protein
MKYGRLLGSSLDIALYEYLAKNTEWGQNFYKKLLDSLSQTLEEDIECILLKELEELGGEPDEFIHNMLNVAITSANFKEIIVALLDDWLNEVIVPRVKGGEINV